MEIALENGRYVPAEDGGLEEVDGTRALAQRLAMKLAARQGGFAPLPDYGSRLYTLPSAARPSERAALAMKLAAEALADESDVTVRGAEVTAFDDGGAEIRITLETGERGALDLRVRI